MKKGKDQFDKNTERISNVAKDHNTKVAEAVEELYENEDNKFL